MAAMARPSAMRANAFTGVMTEDAIVRSLYDKKCSVSSDIRPASGRCRWKVDSLLPSSTQTLKRATRAVLIDVDQSRTTPSERTDGVSYRSPDIHPERVRRV